MSYTPTAEKLLPDLTPREELVLLARTLWREGYNDHLAGHITINLGDGTLLCNPWLLTWDEIRPRDVIRIDLDGRRRRGRLAGAARHPAAPRAAQGAPRRAGRDAQPSDVRHGVERHARGPARCTTRARHSVGASSCSSTSTAARSTTPTRRPRAIEAMGDAELALLAGHGVFVLGASVRAVHQRAVALEQRCKHAWHVRAGGWLGGVAAARVVRRARAAVRRQRVPRVLGSDGPRRTARRSFAPRRPVAASGRMPTPEEELIERYFDAFNRHDLDGVIVCFHDAIVFVSPNGDRVAGINAARVRYAKEFATMPDAHCELRLATGNDGRGVAESVFAPRWPTARRSAPSVRK